LASKFLGSIKESNQSQRLQPQLSPTIDQGWAEMRKNQVRNRIGFLKFSYDRVSSKSRVSERKVCFSCIKVRGPIPAMYGMSCIRSLQVRFLHGWLNFF